MENFDLQRIHADAALHKLPEFENPFEQFHAQIEKIRSRYATKEANIAGVENIIELGEKEFEIWQKLGELYNRTLEAFKVVNLFGSSAEEEIAVLNEVKEEIEHITQESSSTSGLTESQDAYYQWILNRLTSFSGDVQLTITDPNDEMHIARAINRLSAEQKEFFS